MERGYVGVLKADGNRAPENKLSKLAWVSSWRLQNSFKTVAYCETGRVELLMWLAYVSSIYGNMMRVKQ
jgi:hypothetical protein